MNPAANHKSITGVLTRNRCKVLPCLPFPLGPGGEGTIWSGGDPEKGLSHQRSQTPPFACFEAVPAVATRGCESPQGCQGPSVALRPRPHPRLTRSQWRPGLAGRKVFAGALDASLSLQRWHRRKPLKVEDRQGWGEVRVGVEVTWLTIGGSGTHAHPHSWVAPGKRGDVLDHLMWALH